MNKLLLQLPGLMLAISSMAIAEPVTSPSAPAPTAAVSPAMTKPATVPVAPRPAAAAPARPVAPAATTPMQAAPVVSQQPAAISPVAESPAVVTPVITLEQRRQHEMLANAERVDKANRELLARNQELQLQLENLSIQNNVLKRDRSNEGIWKGASAVIVGFLMGWFFAGGNRRKSSW